MTGFFSSSLVQQEKPAGLVPLCGACGLFKRCKSPKMKPSGKGLRRVLIVGEFPGKTEDEDNRHFVGQAGQLLRDTLESIGIDPDEDVWFTNAVICNPGDVPVTEEQVGYCRANLTATILKYKPRVVIALGRFALRSVLMGVWSDIKTMDRWVGWKIPLEQHWVCPTYHPSYLLRMKSPLMERFFKEHLQAAFDITRDTKPLPNWKEKIEILLNEKEIYESIRDMALSEWAAIDYETTCLKPEWPKGQIVSCALSNGIRTISYPWIGAAITATGMFLNTKRVKKIASNLKMEERWTMKVFGSGVVNWGHDTMLAAHCLDNRTGICSLKFQSFVKLGVPIYNKHIEPYLHSSRGPYNRIREIDLNHLLFYGGMDALLEYKLAMKQRKELGYEN